MDNKTIKKVLTIDGEREVHVKRLSYNDVFKLNKFNEDYQKCMERNDFQAGSLVLKDMFSLLIIGGGLPSVDEMLERYPLDANEGGLLYIIKSLTNSQMTEEDKKK